MIHLKEIKATIRPGVELVAVSKFHPASLIQEAYDEGQRIFGESREQELAKKVEALPKDIEWHFIGHLQTNKVKYIAPYISMIDAVDSLKLLREINKQAAYHNRTIKVLLELHIAEEETKYGLSLDACRELLEGGEWRELQNVQICGLMMMALRVFRASRHLKMAVEVGLVVGMTAATIPMGSATFLKPMAASSSMTPQVFMSLYLL